MESLNRHLSSQPSFKAAFCMKGRAQLANEISANYPEIKHICIGQGAQIDIDSLKTTPCIIVKVKTDTLLPDSSLEQLTKWLKVRLQTETIEIDNTTNRL